MTLRRFFNSIITRLLLLGLCILMIGSVLRYYTLTDFLREDLSKVVEGQQLALATYVAHDINDKIVQRQALLGRLAATLPIRLLGQPVQLRAWLQERYESQSLFSLGLSVVNVHGIGVASYPVLANLVNTNYADRDYIQAGLRGSSYIGRPVEGRTAKEPLLPIATPIRDEKGQVQAIMVGVTALSEPEFLAALMQSQIQNGPAGFLVVSPRDMLFVASSQADMMLKPTPPRGVNLLHDRAMAGFRGTGITVNAQGVEEVSAIASIPSAGWFLVARLPSSVAFATVGRLQHFLIKAGMLSIVAFLMLAALGLYLVFRPLFYAAAHAERMTLGELPLEPLPMARNDEIGHLILAFNRLLQKLDDKQAELERIAHYDMLTGLPNRILLYDRLGQALALAHRNKTQIGLLYMDLDGFKIINDTLGHDAGDEALREVASRFAKIVRQADTLARIGGDEFVVLLSDLGEYADADATANAVASKYIDAMKSPFLICGTQCILGISVGVALGKEESSLDSLLKAADRAMYEAKESSRDRDMAG